MVEGRHISGPEGSDGRDVRRHRHLRVVKGSELQGNSTNGSTPNGQEKSSGLFRGTFDSMRLGTDKAAEAIRGAGSRVTGSFKELPKNLLQEATIIGEKVDENFAMPQPPEFDPGKYGPEDIDEGMKDFEKQLRDHQEQAKEVHERREYVKKKTRGVVGVVGVAGVAVAGFFGVVDKITPDKDDTPAVSAPSQDLSGEGGLPSLSAPAKEPGELKNCEPMNSIVISRDCEAADGTEFDVTTNGTFNDDFRVNVRSDDDTYEGIYEGDVGKKPIEIPVKGGECNVYVSNPDGVDSDHHRGLRIQTDC